MINYFALPGMKGKPYIPLHPTAEKIVRVILEKMQLTFEQVTSKKRDQEYCETRQLIALMVRRHTLLSLKAIGRLMLVDHTSVIHSIKRMTALESNEPKFKKLINEIENEL